MSLIQYKLLPTTALRTVSSSTKPVTSKEATIDSFKEHCVKYRNNVALSRISYIGFYVVKTCYAGEIAQANEHT